MDLINLLRVLVVFKITYYFICSLYYYRDCFIVILDHTNIGAETILSLISQIFTEILDLIIFSLMAALICKILIQIFIFSIDYDSDCIIVIFDHINIGADTFFSLLSEFLVEIRSLNHFSLMATVIIKIQVFNFRNCPEACFYVNLHTKHMREIWCFYHILNNLSAYLLATASFSN